MRDYREIDFGRCLTLLNVIVEAGKHGPMFQQLVGAAQAQLRDELAEYPQPETVEPPEGGDPVPNPDANNPPQEPELNLGDNNERRL